MTSLPFPSLEKQEWEQLSIITDNALADAIGVRVAFSGRSGGFSQGPYASLNLGDHVEDDPDTVRANRAELMRVCGASGMPLVVPRQVHGTNVVVIDSADESCIQCAREAAGEGADGLVVTVPGIAALLCFADCVPVVIVSPSGRFAVVHAGWRGVEAGVAPKALRALASFDVEEGLSLSACQAASRMNVYVGPHIHGECFETGADVRARFEERFGAECLCGERHVDLFAALRIDLAAEGADPSRIVDAGACTMCAPDEYFSYRASGGVCGRHGAFAFRNEVDAE